MTQVSASGTEGGGVETGAAPFLAPASPACLCQGGRTSLGLASESQARLQAGPQADPRVSLVPPMTHPGLGPLFTLFWGAWILPSPGQGCRAAPLGQLLPGTG